MGEAQEIPSKRGFQLRPSALSRVLHRTIGSTDLAETPQGCRWHETAVKVTNRKLFQLLFPPTKHQTPTHRDERTLALAGNHHVDLGRRADVEIGRHVRRCRSQLKQRINLRQVQSREKRPHIVKL